MALRRPVTLEEYLEWPETQPYREFIYGEVRGKPLPNRAHSLLQIALGRHLDAWADIAGGEVVSELRCLLDVQGSWQAVLPDVAWFQPQRMTLDDRGRSVAPPNLAVEILSPDERYWAIEEKVALYLLSGVPLVWVVDPEARNVTIHRRGQTPVVLREPAALEDETLPGFSLPLATLFHKLGQTEPGG